MIFLEFLRTSDLTFLSYESERFLCSVLYHEMSDLKVLPVTSAT